MKPLRLSLQAFGPFWNRTEVDFQPCQRQGLFLIHGPVGSGKTTLLDGICFSLYGVSSGGERLPGQLRSDMALAQQETAVEFDFEVEGAPWRVTRKLGDAPQSAQLFSLVTDSQVSQGVADVQRDIERLLGLDATQFRRAVLLPQGQFRQFLLAGVGEREQILSALFHSRSPERSLQLLEKAVQEAESELANAWQRRRQLQGDGPDLREQLTGMQRRQSEVERQLVGWKSQRSLLDQNRERVAVVEERSRERQRIQLELRHLAERQSDLDELDQQAERMRAALKISAQVEQWRQAQHDEQQAAENFARADQELQQRLASLTSPESGAERLQALQQQRLDLQNQIQQLDRRHLESQRLEQAEARLSQVHQTWNQLVEEGEVIERERARARQRLEQADRSHGEESDLKLRLIQEQQKLEKLRTGLKAQRQQHELAQGIERVNQTLTKVAERRSRVLEHIDQLEHDLSERSRQLEHFWSWTLAQRLKPGSPCSVCGALEHPEPAGVSGNPAQLSLEQLRKQLELGWKQAEEIDQEERAQQLNLVRLEERLESLQPESAHPQASHDEVLALTENLRELERQLLRFQHAREHRDRDEQRLRKLEKKHKRWQEASVLARQAVDQSEAILSERREVVGSAQGKLMDQKAQLQLKLAELETEIENHALQFRQDSHLHASFSAAVEAARQSISLSQQRTQLAYELVQTRLQLGNFNSLEEWEKVQRAARHDLDPISQELQAHRAQREHLEQEAERADRLYHESLEPLGGSLEVEPQELERSLEGAQQQVADLRSEIAHTERKLSDYDRCVQEIQRLEPHLDELRRLARVARGENLSGLSFVQWVLAQQMEVVIQSANLRLSQMTGGRYCLETGRHALELQVRDYLSGQSRAVTTLSGGESFLASLALALGLADCFRSGGNHAVLDTLFIDEGFGYLDEEGLDQAFWALESIQRDGRVLGVVSHLAEVRQRIPLRLEIQPSPGGNQVRWSQD